jgi:hypothetical protein
MANKRPKEVKMPNKLPKVLRDEFDDCSLSLAIDMGLDFAVIEIRQCVEEKAMKVEPAVQRLIERAGTYTEYVPCCEGVRMIGWSCGGSIDLDCDARSRGLAYFNISIYRQCDRWVAVSGIPIVDKPFRNLDSLIDGLLAEMKKCIYLK